MVTFFVVTAIAIDSITNYIFSLSLAALRHGIHTQNIVRITIIMHVLIYVPTVSHIYLYFSVRETFSLHDVVISKI